MNEQKKLVPKLRFPEFREFQAWHPCKLSDACEVNPSSPILPDQFVYIDLESVEAGKLIAKKIVKKNEAPSRAQRVLNEGDVIFQMVRPYQRNNFFFQENDNSSYVASTGYAQLRAKDSPEFLFQVVHVDDFVDRVIAKCTGSSYPAINSSDLAEVPLLVPSPNEQQKIADCLSSLDELIAAQARKVEALKTHKKGLMQQLFPREGETQPRLRFPEFQDAGPWKLRKIGSQLVEAQRPIALSDEAEYRLVTVKRRYGGLVSRGVMKGREILVKSQFLVSMGDFLISKRQIVHNACGLVPAELDGSVVSNEYSVLTPKGDCSIDFFSWFAMQPSVSASFMNCSVGIVIEKMLFKLPAWLKQEFLFPNLQEQERIASCLDTFGGLITSANQELDTLKTHKKGLMQQLFPSVEAVEA